MTQLSGKCFGPVHKLRIAEHARVRPLLLVLVCLIVTLGIGAMWFYLNSRPGAVVELGEAPRERIITLTEGTQTVLQRLASPLEIRFYSVLDLPSVGDSLPTFAQRVDELLNAYQAAANGQIKVTRVNSRTDSNSAAAAADGLKPFNLDKGDACYLGLVLTYRGQKEAFPKLSPEWAQALESDLSRGILRLINAASPANAVVANPEIDSATIAEVKRQLPNFASLSLEEGSRMLRESALNDFKAAVSEMETQLKEAEQRISQTQNGMSKAEQQAALLHLQQVQAGHAEKLKQITARSMAQIETLERLKRE